MEQDVIKKRKRQAIETKSRIFEAAISLIEEKGFDHVQIEDISRRANISMGLFYKYFTGKSDVITEAFFNTTNLDYQKIYERDLTETKGIQKIVQMARSISDYHENSINKLELRRHYSNIIKCCYRGNCVTDDDRFLYKMILEALEEAKSLGELPSSIQSKTVCSQLALILRGVVFEYLLREDNDRSFHLAEVAESIFTKYLSGLQLLESKNQTEKSIEP